MKRSNLKMRSRTRGLPLVECGLRAIGPRHPASKRRQDGLLAEGVWHIRRQDGLPAEGVWHLSSSFHAFAHHAMVLTKAVLP